MTTLSLAFRVLVRCPEQGLPAPDRSSPYRKSHLILPKQGRTRDPFTVQSILFRPQQKHPGSAQPATPGARSTPVRYPGQDASGGGAGYRPRVLKRYYESVINLAATLRLCRQMVHCLEAGLRHHATGRGASRLADPIGAGPSGHEAASIVNSIPRPGPDRRNRPARGHAPTTCLRSAHAPFAPSGRPPVASGGDWPISTDRRRCWPECPRSPRSWRAPDRDHGPWSRRLSSA